MEVFDPTEHPHRRYNPLTQEYVLVSPHRAKRPWLGQVEPEQPSSLPQYDPKCYLCPGNSRTSGITNDNYTSTFTFVNDFSALQPTSVETPEVQEHPLLVKRVVSGRCDVICFHPRHDLTLAQLSIEQIRDIIGEWARIYATRSLDADINYVQIFENKGAMMGCSNPHPHCQVWSMSDVPTIPQKEMESFQKYADEHAQPGATKHGGEGCILCTYSSYETSKATDDRIVAKNAHWVALVPFWAVWPFEAMLLPYRRHISSIQDLDSDELYSFASILSEITIRYDNLFSCSFPYSMGIHQAPLSLEATRKKNKEDQEYHIAHLHLHFSPPLLRSAFVRKFLVGFELMAEAQRDLTPEQGAVRLRECPGTHYKNTSA